MDSIITDNTKIWFGKHKGETFGEIPASYLFWLDSQTWCKANVKKYIKDNLDVLNHDLKE